MLHVVLGVVARNGFLFLAGQYPSDFYVACCVASICKQLFVSSRSIPIRILGCMLCCGQLQEIAVCLQPVKTHPNAMLHVVLWVSARNSCLFLAGLSPSDFYVACCVKNSCLSLAGQYPSECYVACCAAGICKKLLFVSSRSIPIRIPCCKLRCGYLLGTAACLQPVNTHPSSVLHVVLWVSARNSCLFLDGQSPSEFCVACCAVGICKQVFVSNWSIPIRILCCMLYCGYLQIAVCFQPVNTHPNSMLHVVLWAFARNCGLFHAGHYPSEFYVACCVVGICKKQLFVSSRSIPIRILCCMLCCGCLQEIAVCFQPVNTHPNSMLHVVLWVFENSCLFVTGQYPSKLYVAYCVVGICKKQLFVSSRSIPIRILGCMLCCGGLQIAVCFQPVNTHPNSMLHVVLWVFANSCLFQLVNTRLNSMLHVVLWVFANSCLFLAGQYPSECYVACCVVGICKQLFVSSRSIPIQVLCCMLCCGQLQEMAVCFQPVNTHPNSMLHVVLWVFAKGCLFLAGQYPSEFYVACCVVGSCKKWPFV